MQNKQQLLNKLFSNLLKRLKNHLENDEFQKFNQLVIEYVKAWCTQGKFAQIQNLLKNVSMLFEHHTKLKRIPIELILFASNKELTLEDLASIGFRYGVGYVRLGKNLYYVDQGNNNFYQIDWMMLSEEIFDKMYKPSMESRVLLERELISITENFQHERIEHMNWYCLLFVKQYAQEILKSSKENKIEIPREVFICIIRNYYHYFVFLNDKTMHKFDIFYEIDRFIDDVNFQNDLKKVGQINFDEQFRFFLNFISSHANTTLLTPSNCDDFFKIQISILDKLLHYFIDTESICQIKLCMVKKAIDVAKNLDDNFDYMRAYEWRIKARLIFDELKDYMMTELYSYDKSLFEPHVLFDTLFKIEVREDYNKNEIELYGESHENHKKILQYYGDIFSTESSSSLSSSHFEFLSRHFLVPKVFANLKSEFRNYKSEGFCTGIIEYHEFYSILKSINSYLHNISQGIFETKDYTILCVYYPSFLRYFMNESLDLNSFCNYICFLSIYALTNKYHESFFFMIDHYVNDLKNLSVPVEMIQKHPLFSVFLKLRVQLETLAQDSHEEKLKKIQELYDDFLKTNCFIMMALMKEIILKEKMGIVTLEKDINLISTKIISLSNEIMEYVEDIKKNECYDYILFAHVCDIQYNFYLGLVHLTHLKESFLTTQYKNMIVDVIKSQKNMIPLLKETSDSRKELNVRQLALDVIARKLMPLAFDTSSLVENKVVFDIKETKTKKKEKSKKPAKSQPKKKSIEQVNPKKKSVVTTSAHVEKKQKERIERKTPVKMLGKIVEPPKPLIETILVTQEEHHSEPKIAESIQAPPVPETAPKSVVRIIKYMHIESEPLKKIYLHAKKKGYEVFPYGGCPRDLLMGKRFNDIDFILNMKRECDSIEEAGYEVNARDFLEEMGYKKNKEFRLSAVEGLEKLITLRLRDEKEHFDIRCDETFKYTAEGIEAFGKSVDFTINGFILRFNEKLGLWELCDSTGGGIQHLKEKKLHKVCSWKIFAGDPNRFWRELKLHVRDGFELSVKFIKKIQQNPALLFHEKANFTYYLRGLFSCSNVKVVFLLLKELGILSFGFPELCKQMDKIEGLEKSILFSLEENVKKYMRYPKLLFQSVLEVLRGQTDNRLEDIAVFRMGFEVDKAFGFNTNFEPFCHFLWKELVDDLICGYKLSGEVKQEIQKTPRILFMQHVNCSHYLQALFSSCNVKNAFILLKELGILEVCFPELCKQMKMNKLLEEAVLLSLEKIDKHNLCFSQSVLPAVIQVLRGKTSVLLENAVLFRMSLEVNQAFDYQVAYKISSNPNILYQPANINQPSSGSTSQHTFSNEHK